MRLDKVKKGIDYEVTELHGDKDLNARLLSFGISKGASIRVVAFGIMHSTINVEVDESGCVALRHSEANAIEVKELIDG